MPRYQYQSDFDVVNRGYLLHIKDLERIARQYELAGRPKGINIFAKQYLTKHQQCLRNIMTLEHDLGFHNKPDQDCTWCWYDSKLNGIVPSHYDPTIEGVICR